MSPKRIIVGVAGGIAAYKACSVVRQLCEAGHDVRVIPTESALNFVGAATFEALSGHPVRTGVFSDVPDVPHVRLGQQADLVVVAPATADLLARAVIGRADDMLVVRGVNVFPSAIEELVRTQADLTDEYRIVLDDTVRDAAGFLKAIRLQVEASNAEHVGALLAQRVRERLGVHAIVDVLQPGTLERSTHKARRIIRQ